MSIVPVANRRVLIDQTGSARLSLVEDTNGKKLFAEGKIGQCDVPTANGRVYPRNIIEREINKLQERINAGSLLGAVDHPGDGKSRIRDAGHIVRKLWIENDGAVHGRFEIVEECDAGKTLAAFLRHGASIGVSSRGLGSTRMNEQGQEVVAEDFRLSSYDFVSDPAVSTAYPTFFTEDKDLAEKVTADALRAKFPKLIKQIEESAHEVAKDTCLDAVRAEVESDVEQALTLSKESIRESIKTELIPEIIKELRDDFAVKLVRTLQSQRKEVEESVRSELSSDPKVAGAKLALEQVAKLVAPFSPPADVKKMLGEKDAAVTSCQVELSSTKKMVSESQELVAKAELTSRELAFKLFVEQALAGRPDVATLREMVGDVKLFSNAKELKLRVDGVIKTANNAIALAETKAKTAINTERKLSEHKINLARKRADRTQVEKNQLAESLEKKINDLNTKFENVVAAKDSQITAINNALLEAQTNNSKLEVRLNGAIKLAESVKVQNFAEQRAVGHPRRRELLESVARGKAKSKADVNRLAEDLEPAADEPGGVGERVRRAMSRGKETLSESERLKQEILNEDTDLIPGLEDFGISTEEILNLSGLSKNSKGNK